MIVQAQTVDRIIAKVEGNILTLSELRELEKMQKLLEGSAEPDERLFERLVDQWIVLTEMDSTGFPAVRPDELEQRLDQLVRQFPTPEAYRARLAEVGLRQEDVARFLERQLRILNYLDYKFRAAAVPDPAAARRYYDEEFLPAARKRGETPSDFEDVEGKIRDLLTEKEITARTEKWLEETRARLKIERIPEKQTP